MRVAKASPGTVSIDLVVGNEMEVFAKRYIKDSSIIGMCADVCVAMEEGGGALMAGSPRD